MSRFSPGVSRQSVPHPSTILRQVDDWGLISYDLCNPPRRFWADVDQPPPVVEPAVDSRHVQRLPSPAELLRVSVPETWMSRSRAALARFWTYFLVSEDPQRRLDAREVSTLAHQVSLVRHILEQPHLHRVLIADEVGLGKTVEVGLLVKELLEQNAGLHILYLAPARLVNNVRWEFERLGLDFRQWSASAESDGRIEGDSKLIASIHRAVHPNHFRRLVDAPPWDLLIVDECHHLSDWAPGGGDPTRKFDLVRKLIEKQAPTGRVVFLSGTPHQGNIHRFDNLLKLLKRREEPERALAGRVIYRTKDDVSDWSGRPLFPGRQVGTPIVIDLGSAYRHWMDQIHDFFLPPRDDRSVSTARRRSANWRCAQALQWAASSPHAGLGYLVRHSMRAGWTLSTSPVLREALAALRPYRMGAPTEPVEALFQRMMKEIERQREDADIEDLEDDEDETALRRAADRMRLEELLSEGIRLLSTSADVKWTILKERVLDHVGTEKVVLFAQPIETVSALSGYLQRTTGQRPALIIGGQDDATRAREIARFRAPDGPQFLVSSRAGGEGINLQVARRLVHIDVPWNPMEMEQRVGRVHRFGSRQTILIDTLVVQDSREANAFAVARQKLAMIADVMVVPEKFETLFSRVMCLIPPEEIQDVIVVTPGGTLTAEQEQRLAELVRDGYRNWDEFHRRFAGQQRQIKALNPGLATWEDLRQFLKSQAGAQPAEGFRSQRFEQLAPGTLPVAVEEPAPVLVLDDGLAYYADEHDGSIITGPDNTTAITLGLNRPAVAESLRRQAFPATANGAAHLRWAADGTPPLKPPFGVLVFHRQRVRVEGSSWVEHGQELKCYLVPAQGEVTEFQEAEKGILIRGLLNAVIRREPEPEGPLHEALLAAETELIQQLRRPERDEIDRGLRHTVFPLLAAIIGPSG